jgi:hypothetical protein
MTKPLGLPRFDDTRDNMDAYITRFEKYANLQKWDTSIWALNLGTLLTGKGLEVYDSLTPEEQDIYTILKDALLRRYLLTEEGFRDKYKNSKPEAGESAEQYIIRISKYLRRWIALAGSNESFEGIFDLFVRDRFVHSCPHNMANHIVLHEPKSTAELAELADRYLKMQGGTWYSDDKMKGKVSNKFTPKVQGQNTGQYRSTPRPNTGNRPFGQPYRPNDRSTNSAGQSRPSGSCYICGIKGHIANNCFRKGTLGLMMDEADSRSSLTNYDRPNDPGNQSLKESEIQQQSTQTEFRPNNSIPQASQASTVSENSFDQSGDMNKIHSLRSNEDRPNRYSQSNISDEQTPSIWNVGSGYGSGHEFLGLMCSGFDPYTVDFKLHEKRTQIQCGCQREFVGGVCRVHWDKKRMPLKEGKVSETKVKVYRDTGCSGIVVKRSLVQPHQYTGSIHTCYLIDGTERMYPVVTIDIETPYLDGRVYAIAMETPICDLIIGQYPGARDPDVAITSTESIGIQVNLTATEVEDHHVAAAVETRAQRAARTKPYKPLITMPPDEDDVTPEKIRNGQANDPSLQRIRERVITGERKRLGDGSSDIYIKQDGIIYRERQSLNTEYTGEVKQLVVPSTYRKTVLRLAHEALLGDIRDARRLLIRSCLTFIGQG